MFCVIFDLARLNTTKHVPVLACSVLVMWLKLVYFGRMFLSTAWMVRMMIGTVVDLRWFIFVFYSMVFAFSNAFLILSRIDNTYFIGYTFDKSLEYVYQTVIGAFNTGVFPSTGYNIEIYIIWLICTFLLFIVMLNMLIALVNDIFEKIHENINNNLLKELVVLMVESEQLISRSTLFYGKKYIIVIKKEKGDDTANDNDSKLAIIKAHMDKNIDNQSKKVDTITQNLDKKINEELERRYNRLELSTTQKLDILAEEFDEYEEKYERYREVFEKIMERKNKRFIFI